MRKPLALPLVLTLSLGLTGCADLFSALGVLGVTVTGQVRVPEAQKASIMASFPGEVSVGANADVQTYSLLGFPVPNSTAKTDASGQFTVPGVPAERVSILRASVTGKSGKTLRLAGLVKASGGSTVTELSAVSTIVAEGLLRTVGTSRLETMSQDQITELEHVVVAAGGTAGLTVDLTGAEGPASRFETIVAADAEVRDLVAAIKSNTSTAALR